MQDLTWLDYPVVMQDFQQTLPWSPLETWNLPAPLILPCNELEGLAQNLLATSYLLGPYLPCEQLDFANRYPSCT